MRLDACGNDKTGRASVHCNELRPCPVAVSTAASTLSTAMTGVPLAPKSTKSTLPALLPSARTVSLRFGVDGRWQLGSRFGVVLGAAYLAPIEHGEIYDRFRAAHLHGIDGDLALAIGLVPGIELRPSARYTRYFASFKPVPGDAIVAGGALDEQFQFGIGVRYAH